VKRPGGFDHSKFNRDDSRGGKPQGGGKDFAAKARGDFNPRGEAAPAPRGERPTGKADFQDRSGFKPTGERPQRSGQNADRSSFQPRSEGNFAPRGARPQGGQDRDGFKPRSEGGFAARQGRYVPRDRAPGNPPQDQGASRPRTEGFAPRAEGTAPNRDGGFAPRQGRFQPNAGEHRNSYRNRAERNENYGFPDSERWSPNLGDRERQQQEDREWQRRQGGQRFESQSSAPQPNQGRDPEMDGYRSRGRSRQEPKEWTPVDGESGIVAGLHAVEALLDNQSGRVQRLLLLRGSNSPELHKIQAKAEDLGIPCQQLEQRQLDIKGEGHRHGGVIALCNARDYTEWGPLRRILLEDAEEGGNPVVLVGAAIEDPRNLGAIIRSGVGLGAKALILPRKGGCGLTGIVDETSAGALSCLPVSRPADLEAVLKDLASKGFKIIGLDSEGEVASKVDLTGPLVLIAGGEDKGLPPHLRRPCTRLLRLPMDDRLQSYNASVAASLALYEAVRQRGLSN
jgi:23S rRNA (guanosine2251-2'-O)-methyltransferase